MPTLANGTFFSAMSPLPDYERELKVADDSRDVPLFVQLIRGLYETWWHKEKPQSITVSREMRSAMMDRLSNLTGIGYSLHGEGDSLSIVGIPVVARSE